MHRASEGIVLIASMGIEKRPKLPAPGRISQLGQSPGFDLADALTGERKTLLHLLQRVVGVVDLAEFSYQFQ